MSLVYIFRKKNNNKKYNFVANYDMTGIFGLFFINSWINSDNLDKKYKE